MTIFGISNLVPSAALSSVAASSNASSIEGQQQQQQGESHVEQTLVEEKPNVEQAVVASGPVDDDISKQFPNALLSSFVQLTENSLKFTENDDDEDDMCNTSGELIPSNDLMLAMDRQNDDNMHCGPDDDDEDWSLGLDGSADSHGLLASSGGGLTPFTSRAHAAAAFGRLAKRAITFGDLIAAVDCFTAAYGQLEQNEQRIVIARMYFLNRQLLYCQHDIIRQKQALAVAALAEAQTKAMLESGQPQLTDPNCAPVIAGSVEALAGHFMTSPEIYRSRNPFASYNNPDNGPPPSFTSQFFRSMMAPPPGDRPNQQGVDFVMTSTTTTSPILKPGVPLVQLQARRTEFQPSQQKPPVVQPPKQYHHPHHPEHQPQPVRLDAKHLLLLQYLQNNNASDESSFGNNKVPLIKSSVSVPGNSQPAPRNNIDVGIQVCLPPEPVIYRQKGPNDGPRQPFNNRGRPQSMQPPRGSRRPPVTWWPGVGPVDDEVMFSQSRGNEPMPPMMMPQMPQRRQSNNRRPPPLPVDFGGFFDDEMMTKQNGPGFGDYNRPMMPMAPPQQQAIKQICDHNNLIEQLLMVGKFNPNSVLGNNNNKQQQQQDFCSCSQPEPRSSVPLSTSQGQQQPNPLSQQAVLMMNRPLRRFDNCEFNSESA